MIPASRDKIFAFVEFLRAWIQEQGVDCKNHTDEEILAIGRRCYADDEQITLQQQMHTILEFDTPEAAFDAMLEQAYSDVEDPEVEEEDERAAERFFSASELIGEDWDDGYEEEDDEEILEDMFDDFEDLDNLIVSVEKVLGFLKTLRRNGFSL